jgi:hypothetical protein
MTQRTLGILAGVLLAAGAILAVGTAVAEYRDGPSFAAEGPARDHHPRLQPGERIGPGMQPPWRRMETPAPIQR